jgi:ABC-2 type transport system ATP-binding protein
MSAIVRVKNLTRQYGGLTAVDHISFEIGEGEIVSSPGPNGAGKTTIVQMLITLVSPSGGDIEISEKTLRGHREELLSMMNFTAPYSVLPHNLTTREALKVYSLLHGVRNYRERANFLIDEFDLG